MRSPVTKCRRQEFDHKLLEGVEYQGKYTKGNSSEATEGHVERLRSFVLHTKDGPSCTNNIVSIALFFVISPFILTTQDTLIPALCLIGMFFLILCTTKSYSSFNI